MLKAVGLGACLVLLVSVGLSSQPIGTMYDLHRRYEQVEMIELVPGVEVPSDMWPDSHMVTLGDLVSVGVPLEDAESLVGQCNTEGAVIPCPWSAMKRCFFENIPLEICCPKTKGNG